MWKIFMSSQNYTNCLQTKYDNRRNFNVQEMSIFDLHVDSTSKLHRKSINSKFPFSLEWVARRDDVIKAQDGSRS